MSNDFNILEYLNTKSDRLPCKRNDFTFALPSFYQRTEEDSLQDQIDVVLRRHFPFGYSGSTIKIRQVREFFRSHSTPRSSEVTHEDTPGVVVKAVRPYARLSRTSSYWQDCGWERRNGCLIGHYRVARHWFPGSIELKDSIVEPAKYYIYNPPTAILEGPHGACYRYQGRVSGAKKYFVHWVEEPQNWDSGIIQIEKDLRAAIHGS